MNGHFVTNGIYPLSVTPAEGYGSDPLTRTGKQILSHVNGKHVRVDDAEAGTFTLVEDRKDATRFDDLNVASTSALDLITKARTKHAEKQAA